MVIKGGRFFVNYRRVGRRLLNDAMSKSSNPFGGSLARKEFNKHG
jgi:hypothetical protein